MGKANPGAIAAGRRATAAKTTPTRSEEEQDDIAEANGEEEGGSQKHRTCYSVTLPKCATRMPKATSVATKIRRATSTAHCSR